MEFECALTQFSFSGICRFSLSSPPSLPSSPILLARGSHKIAYYPPPGEREFWKRGGWFRGLIFSCLFGLKNVQKNSAIDNRRRVSYSSVFAVASHAHYNIAFERPVRTRFGRIARVGFQIKYAVCNLRTENRLQRRLGSVENSKFDYIAGERIFFVKKNETYFSNFTVSQKLKGVRFVTSGPRQHNTYDNVRGGGNSYRFGFSSRRELPLTPCTRSERNRKIPVFSNSKLFQLNPCGSPRVRIVNAISAKSRTRCRYE